MVTVHWAGRAVVASLVVASACAGGGGDRAGPGAGSPGPTVAPSTTTPRPTVPPPAQVASCPAVPEQARPAPGRPSYRLGVDVRLDQNLVAGTSSVRFTPDIATDRLVFRLWPNGPRLAAAGAWLEAGPVAVDGREAESRSPDPTTLVVTPVRPLDAGRAVAVELAWTLTLPGTVRDRVAREGEAVRLGSFFPILAWEPGVGWALDPPTTGFAEASTAPVADFELEVRVPAGLGVLASGTEVAPGRWRAEAMRDVAVSVGRFRTVQAVARAPHPVAVTVAVDAGVAEAPEDYLQRVVPALEDFALRFGPYPWPTYSLSITPGLAGGIEYPSHVLQGPGSQARTTVHEVAHQWFYGLVGNDQGRDPWLDEGLATWGELRHEQRLGELGSAVVPPAAVAQVGRPMTFWDDRPGDYFAGVYVQGAMALAALGDPDLVDCALRVYVAVNAHAIARPADLVAAALSVFPGADRVLARFGAVP